MLVMRSEAVGCACLAEGAFGRYARKDRSIFTDMSAVSTAPSEQAHEAEFGPVSLVIEGLGVGVALIAD